MSTVSPQTNDEAFKVTADLNNSSNTNTPSAPAATPEAQTASGSSDTKSPPPLDAPVDVPPITGVEAPGASITITIPSADSEAVTRALAGLKLCRNYFGQAFLATEHQGHREALEIGGGKANKLLRKLFTAEGIRLRPRVLSEVNDLLLEAAEDSPIEAIWNRIAPYKDGIEIYLGDASGMRARVEPSKVSIITEGSETLFSVPPAARALPIPADTGNYRALKSYVNVSDCDFILLIAWITYTIAHPKVSTSNYVFLVLTGPQGSGKSSLCRNVIQALIDPSILGLQAFPSRNEDLALLSSSSHLICWDNMRHFNAEKSNLLCTAATGGSVSKRALYTDTGLNTQHLHCAYLFNGIHNFVQQPDLAQRCLPLQTLPMKPEQRRSEAEMARKLNNELPGIYRGLLDLVARILVYLPSVKPKNPERMIEFSFWLAAIERAEDAPEGGYQGLYSEALQQTQLDSLMDHPLAAAMIKFAGSICGDTWSGEPVHLLSELANHNGFGSRYSKEWPDNPIALSKRLRGLEASLRTQGIEIEFSRGKHRKITVRTAGFDDDSSIY